MLPLLQTSGHKPADLTEAVIVYTYTAATKLRKKNQKAAEANVYFHILNTTA